MKNIWQILSSVFDGSSLTVQPSNSAEILNVVFSDDETAIKVQIADDGGIILNSPNGTAFNITVDNLGNLVSTEV